MSRLTEFVVDAVGLAGAGAIAYGAWMVMPAAGLIVGGALALTGALYLSRPAPPSGNR